MLLYILYYIKYIYIYIALYNFIYIYIYIYNVKYDHVKCFRNQFYANCTTLSSYVWDTKKRKNVTTALTWELQKHIPI